MAFKLKYIQYRKGKIFYRRRVPADLVNVFGKTFYYKQLPCKADATDSEITEAWSEINSIFESVLETSRAKLPKEIEDEKLKRDAIRYLRLHKLDVGKLKKLADLIGTEPWELHPTAFKALEDRHYDELKYYETKSHLPVRDFEINQPPSYREQVIRKAWELAITNSGKLKPKILLSECWNIYNNKRKEGAYDKNTRKGRRVYASWERLLSYIDGDCLIEDTDTIYDAIDRMIADREKEVSAASIERDWIVISAVLNKVIKVERLNLKFQKPIIKQHTKKERAVFTQSDQIDIVKDILTHAYQADRGILMLLALQAGIINSELQRLRSDNLKLNENIPYIVITGEVKTKDRKRIIPVTVGVSWLRKAFEFLQDDSGYAMGAEFANAKDSTISKRIVLALDKYSKRDNKRYSCYSLRHCFKANAISHNAPPRYQYIGGWVNKEAVISDTYAKDAMTQETVLGGLQEVSKTVNKHLLGLDSLRVLENKVS